jgi:hypothetical protein
MPTNYGMSSVAEVSLFDKFSSAEGAQNSFCVSRCLRINGCVVVYSYDNGHQFCERDAGVEN